MSCCGRCILWLWAFLCLCERIVCLLCEMWKRLRRRWEDLLCGMVSRNVRFDAWRAFVDWSGRHGREQGSVGRMNFSV